MTKSKLLFSACLVGVKSRYDGTSQTVPKLLQYAKEGNAVFVCPEQIAGFPTPREPAEIEHGRTAKDVLEGKGRVFTKSGVDVTDSYVQAAKATLAVCIDLNIQTAILKAASPSCGAVQQYDGTFSDTKVLGSGVTAELLKQNGIQVYDDEHFPPELLT